MTRKRLQSSVDAPATVRTVAALAGVSIASASRVLNGLGGGSETTQRVREAAAKLGYVPNAIARSLQARRTGLLAFAVADIGNPVYVEMMRAIEEIAKDAGYQLLVHVTGADPASETALLDGLARRYVDGMILSPLRVGDGHIAALERSPVPVVVVGHLPDDAPFDNVRADSRAGVKLAVEHLAAAGRTRIAFVNGATDTLPGAARLGGYRDAMAAVGLGYDENLVEIGDFSYEPGRAATARLLARVTPDAILCANDLIAAGALHELLAGGRRVPDDVALVGMDDTALAEMPFPQISSVSLGAAERGRIAAGLLISRLADPSLPPRRETVAPSLTVRASSEVVPG
ncbi:MAG TPA: LacI family DNA-binding transcriptional regulator [Asanoa sp.]|nr:LacI family DNA-binding transcriptional regulator [Asanoa sp.]